MKWEEQTKTFMMISNCKKPSVSMVYTTTFQRFNPLSPHDALMHHFTYLKADLIFLQPMVLERTFS